MSNSKKSYPITNTYGRLILSQALFYALYKCYLDIPHTSYFLNFRKSKAPRNSYLMRAYNT